jgi:hypothetical protein
MRRQLFLLLLAWGLTPWAAGQVVTDRTPFALEVTELQTGRIAAHTTYIARTDVNSVKFWVLEPYASKVDWSQVRVKINGNAAAALCRQIPVADGKTLLCDLNRIAGFRLAPDKNVFEIEAQDRAGRPYYASFVLVTDAAEAARERRERAAAAVASTVKVEETPVTGGDDTVCPEIVLHTPLSALMPARPIELRLTVRDAANPIAAVTINGEDALAPPPVVAPPKAKKSSIVPAPTPVPPKELEVSKVIPPGVKNIVVEARDSAGNQTRLTLPVLAVESANVLHFSGRKFAVIIGVSEYQFTDAGLKNLRYADDDAQSLYDFLLRPEGGGFDSNNVLFLVNRQATLSAVRDSLTRFLTKANETDLVLFYLSGHGTPDPYDKKTLYFLLHDSKVADLKRTALPMDELKRIIDTKLRARRAIFFLDTCHSAGVSDKEITDKRGVEDQGESNIINQYALTQLYGAEGRAMLTSSDVSEISLEGTQWGGGHGVFTWALLEGLRGQADLNRDKFVTTGELFAFVGNAVRLETKGRQNPRALPGSNAALELAKAP